MLELASMAPFDPYHKWLGIPKTERPISKYRLLALADFEVDRDVISTAAERQTVFLRTLQAGEHAVLVADLLNEVSQARVTLLNADQKAEYDEQLRKQQAPEPVPEPTPPPIPVVQTTAPTPVVVRGTVTQEFPVSVVQPAKKPRRRKPKQIWKRPAVIGISLVGVIGVLVLVISMMSSGDAEPVATNTPPVVTSPIILSPEPEPATAKTLPASLREGLVAYYPFNGNANDESGNGNHGEVTGATLTADRMGTTGKAYEFIKANKTDRIKIPGETLNAASAFTWSAWVTINTGSLRKWDNFISGVPNATDHNEFIIGTLDNKFKIYFKGKHVKGFSVMSWPSKWMHVVVARSSIKSPFKVFIDGVFIEDFVFSDIGSPNIDPNGLVLGNEQDSVGGGFTTADALGGKLDDVRIYKRALSAAEVKSLYDYESKPPASSIPTAPVIESITNTIGMTLNKIPAGTFMMGSPAGEADLRDDEYQHKVTITKPFFM
jgi:preprotein translocase subunit Sss1